MTGRFFSQRAWVLGCAMVGITILVSCQSQNEDGGNLRNSLQLRAFQTDFADSTQQSTENIATKATETKFQNGDAVGIFVHTAATVAANDNHSSNLKYFTQDAGSSWTAASSVSSPFTVGGSTKYYSTAYYPHKQGVANAQAIEHSVASDQSAIEGADAGNLENSDFMIANPKALTVKNATDASVTLGFRHVMTKLVVSVIAPVAIDNVGVAKIKTVTITGLNSACAINLASGAVTPKAPAVVTTITPRLCAGTGAAGDPSSWEAIVVPQTVPAATKMVEFICIMEDGSEKALNYTTPAASSLKLTSGSKVTLTLSSSADLAFLTAVSFIDGSAKSDVEMQIKATSGVAWELTSAANWLTISKTAGGTYSNKIAGTGTGVGQSVYISVGDNNGALAIPREAALTLTSTASGASSMTYKVFQNYTLFNPPTTPWNLSSKANQSQAIPAFASNVEWTIRSADISGAPLGATISTTANGAPLPLPYTGLGSLAANSLFMQVPTENNSSADRVGKITIETTNITPKKIAEIPIRQYYIPTVLVGGAKWTLGNLIANGANGCKAGGPTDLGLLFQFGSLIGSPDGSAASTTAIAVKPAAYVEMTWGSAYTSSGNILADNPAAGTGDPCRYYLGSAYRLPTSAEITVLIAVSNSWSAPYRTFGGVLQMRASGWRRGGVVNAVDIAGYYLSSTPIGGSCYCTNISSVNANLYSSERYDGQSVRCVKN